MTPEDVDLVQTTFASVGPIGETAAGLFYGRPFEIAPEVRPLFKGDMAEQGRKLIATLAYTTLSNFMIGEAYGRTTAPVG